MFNEYHTNHFHEKHTQNVYDFHVLNQAYRRFRVGSVTTWTMDSPPPNVYLMRIVPK